VFTAAELAAMHQYGVIPPSVTQQVLAYSHLRYGLTFATLLVTWLTLWLVLQTGWAARMRTVMERRIKNPYALIALFIPAIVALLFLLRLPYNYYSSFQVEHAFGLTQQSLGDWLLDLIKAKSVSIVELIIGWEVALFAVRKFPRRWPLALWLLITPITAAMIFLYPLLVDPLFNSYSPMPQSPLRASLQRLAAQAGIPDAPIFIVDKSKQTNKINAEVTGLGSSARIVIWDTSLKKLPDDQIIAVVGHELGHYALWHVFIGFVLISGGLLVGLHLLAWILPWFLEQLPERWQVRGITDPVIIPALMLTFSVLGFFAEPFDNGVSRLMEHQADEFGLKVTKDRGAMARTFVSLSKENLSEPDPPAFINFWFFSHPSLRERIDFALGIKDAGGR
jgi:STE24 endopeptidase